MERLELLLIQIYSNLLKQERNNITRYHQGYQDGMVDIVKIVLREVNDLKYQTNKENNNDD